MLWFSVKLKAQRLATYASNVLAQADSSPETRNSKPALPYRLLKKLIQRQGLFEVADEFLRKVIRENRLRIKLEKPIEILVVNQRLLLACFLQFLGQPLVLLSPDFAKSVDECF